MRKKDEEGGWQLALIVAGICNAVYERNGAIYKRHPTFVTERNLHAYRT